ncbi:TetR/AcrR family transcriptional regulator [Saliterribacillus persicus]|uniref:TetR family transcriptional regulator n=1 Tax=Saliterribacillus persicus TaxID=930114 RepID=A0A368X8J2_9BACI|nr:TetR/AcrR family transcriptional regulator [Saliterribacillus persicus]RCW62737.1 TetR family transcriptional regulator [Saliterribacillus persicus]
MDGFKKRTEMKKQTILQAALTLFLKHGLQKVSIAMIANEANVSQVTIYNYYESKDNLIHKVIHFYIDKTYQDYEALLESDLDFPDKINQIIFNKTEVSQEIHEELYSYLMKDLNDSNYLDRIYQEKGLPYFKKLIDEGKNAGYIDPALSEHAIMYFIQILKDSMQKEAVYESILPLTEDIMNIFFYGIMGKR